MLQNPAKRPGQIAVKWVLEFRIELNVFCWVFVFYFHLFFFEFVFIFPLPPWREQSSVEIIIILNIISFFKKYVDIGLLPNLIST